MCLNPTFVYHPDGVEYGKITLPCRSCWQCVEARKNDYVGRCLAEASTSSWSCAMLLTYADGPERERDLAHQVLYPLHLQKFIRSLRKRGHGVRYFACGENGSEKGRAHFHVALFGQGKAPAWPDDRKKFWHHDAWKHGFVTSEFTPDVKAYRYLVKYMLKDEKYFTLSKKPPLGHDFFMKLASRDHRLGVIPYNWGYSPPGGRRSHTYLMTGATRRNYLTELARLSGIDLTALPDRGNIWLQKSCYKADKLWSERRKEAENLVLTRANPEVATQELIDELKAIYDQGRMKLLPWSGAVEDGWSDDPVAEHFWREHERRRVNGLDNRLRLSVSDLEHIVPGDAHE